MKNTLVANPVINKELNTNAAKAPTSNEYWWRLTDLKRCIRVNEAFSSMLEIIDNNCFDHLKHTSKDEKLKFLKKLTKFITIRTDQYKKAFVKDKSDVTRAYINLSKLFVKNFYSGSVKDIEKNEESFKLMMTMALELQYYFEDCIEQFS
jgi:hypothetical protein